jgi:hypothetical protein
MAGKVPAAAPGGSAPVGTAPPAAARAGTQPRRRPGAASSPGDGGPAPSTAAQRAGTRAVKQARRDQAHQSYVQGLSGQERQSYEQGEAQQRSAERRSKVSGALDQVAQLGGGGGPVDTGSGFILGLLVWGWVVMPFLKDGPAGVRKVLMAKFLNKSPDGKWLP